MVKMSLLAKNQKLFFNPVNHMILWIDGVQKFYQNAIYNTNPRVNIASTDAVATQNNYQFGSLGAVR